MTRVLFSLVASETRMWIECKFTNEVKADHGAIASNFETT